MRGLQGPGPTGSSAWGCPAPPARVRPCNQPPPRLPQQGPRHGPTPLPLRAVHPRAGEPHTSSRFCRLRHIPSASGPAAFWPPRSCWLSLLPCHHFPGGWDQPSPPAFQGQGARAPSSPSQAGRKPFPRPPEALGGERRGQGRAGARGRRFRSGLLSPGSLGTAQCAPSTQLLLISCFLLLRISSDPGPFSASPLLKASHGSGGLQAQDGIATKCQFMPDLTPQDKAHRDPQLASHSRAVLQLLVTRWQQN